MQDQDICWGRSCDTIKSAGTTAECASWLDCLCRLVWCNLHCVKKQQHLPCSSSHRNAWPPPKQKPSHSNNRFRYCLLLSSPCIQRSVNHCMILCFEFWCWGFTCLHVDRAFKGSHINISTQVAKALVSWWIHMASLGWTALYYIIEIAELLYWYCHLPKFHEL